MSKHTPEPWTEDQHRRAFQEDNRLILASCRLISDEDYSRAVACVNGCKGIDPAAVPDLLEACKNLLPFVERWIASARVPGSDTSEWADERAVRMARAAIAKAEGDAK